MNIKSWSDAHQKLIRCVLIFDYQILLSKLLVWCQMPSDSQISEGIWSTSDDQRTRLNNSDISKMTAGVSETLLFIYGHLIISKVSIFVVSYRYDMIWQICLVNDTTWHNSIRQFFLKYFNFSMEFFSELFSEFFSEIFSEISSEISSENFFQNFFRKFY